MIFIGIILLEVFTMKKAVVALVLVLCVSLAASAELSEPVKLIFAAQEVGTGVFGFSGDSGCNVEGSSGRFNN